LAATPYKPTTWADEPVFKDKLNQMTNNDQWLYENTPRLNFNTYGVKRTSGVKIMAAIAIIPASGKAWSNTTFNFGTFFSSGCRPVVVTGTQVTGPSAWRQHVVITGLVGDYAPDHRGFRAHAGADKGTSVNNVINERIFVHFIAIGW
jgi:hypothetical protein